jgi:hypothetical protein
MSSAAPPKFGGVTVPYADGEWGFAFEPLVIDDAPIIEALGYLPALTGTATPGATIRVRVDGGSARTATANGAGAWFVSMADIVTTGTYSLAVTQETDFGESGYTVLLGVTAYAAETWAILNRWTALGTTASKARADALDTILVKPMKTAGLWAKGRGIYSPGHSADASRVNLFDPAGALLTLTNLPTIVVDRYFAGDGVSAAFDTGINPVTAVANYVQDSATLAVWSLTDVANNAYFDVGMGTAARLFGRNASGSLGARANASATTTVAVANSLGLYGFTRNNGAGHDFFRGGSIVSSPTQASTALASATFKIGSDGLTSYSVRRIAFVFIGAGLTSGQIADLNTITTAWLTYLGAI